MDRKVSKNIFLASILILLIFLIIAYSGIMLYDNYKKDKLEDDYSLLTQQILLDDLFNNYLAAPITNINKCEVLHKQLDSQLDISNQLFERLRLINKNAIVESDNKLKYMYILTNIRLWLHYNNINKECNEDNRSILYFYPEIAGFSTQKAESDAKTIMFERKLSTLSEKCNLRSFALPYINYIPILKQIISDYNITNSPAVVINGKVYYDIPSKLDNTFLEEINCN
ncbi:MAG: hypothetical protein V1824_01135 [archaeon]